MKEIIIALITVIGGIAVAFMNNKRLTKKKHSIIEPEQPEEKIEEDNLIENISQNVEVLIFILDDNIDDIKLVTRVIEKMGEKCLTFINKDDYLENIPSSANVHIIDHYLTVGYGWEILLELKKRNRSNFVILYSGTQDKKTVEGYRPYKIDQVVYKDDIDSKVLLEKAILEGLNSIRLKK